MQSLTVQQSILSDQKAEKESIVSQLVNQEQVYQQQISALDKQQQDISDMIEQMEDQLRASFNPELLPSKRHGVIAFPTAEPAHHAVLRRDEIRAKAL